ncbi:hypothetical protein NDU88_002338 [Pleurodeles waltl]|uniref:Uncharacterized protein n=1 Tax=Pleurodeles waltl TaxID=8319 RepID=A0AAV7UB28_PLEWA|nr:hypothetical protein NDU88_002338 [Pleurodeles waltl]
MGWRSSEGRIRRANHARAWKHEGRRNHALRGDGRARAAASAARGAARGGHSGRRVPSPAFIWQNDLCYFHKKCRHYLPAESSTGPQSITRHGFASEKMNYSPPPVAGRHYFWRAKLRTTFYLRKLFSQITPARTRGLTGILCRGPGSRAPGPCGGPHRSAEVESPPERTPERRLLFPATKAWQSVRADWEPKLKEKLSSKSMAPLPLTTKTRPQRPLVALAKGRFPARFVAPVGCVGAEQGAKHGGKSKTMVRT